MITLAITKCQGKDENGDYIVDATISSNEKRTTEVLRCGFNEIMDEELLDRLYFEEDSLCFKDIEFTYVCMAAVIFSSEMGEEAVINADAVFFKEDMLKIADFYYKIKGGNENA